MTALGGVLAFIPLFDVVGFELAFAVCIPASLAVADTAAARTARSPLPSVWRAFARAALEGLAIALPPLLLITLNGLRVPPCDPGIGLAFYGLLPGVSVLLAAATGVVAGTVFARAPRVAILAAWLFVVGSIAVSVYRFYAAPPIFAYDPFGGYFPGTLYDEDITVPAALLWARLYHVAIGAAALCLCDAWRRRRLAAALGGIVLAAGGGAILHRSADLGFNATADDITEALGGRFETTHFTIVYPRGAAFEADIERIGDDHELSYRQAAAALGVTTELRITSFYFDSVDEKARWMGAQHTYIAKPWRREIYVTHEELPHDVIRHEIGHVLAGTFGDPTFHVSVDFLGWPPLHFNVGLIEGAAVAADWPTPARLTPHEAARAMLDLGYLPPLSTILAPGFLSFASARSYTTAGSFCRWLLDHHDAARFHELYRSGGRPADFARIYGAPLADLDAEWRAFLAGITVPPDEREIARERFRRRGIFGRPCPHLIARLERLAGEIASRRPERAVDMMREVCAADPDEPSHRLVLAGMLERAKVEGEARRIYTELAADVEQSSPLRARALVELADLTALAGERPAALAAVEQALALPVDESARRNLILRKQALAGDEPLFAYLFARSPGGGDADPVQLMYLARRIEGGLGRYLEGRLLFQRGAHPEAAAALAEAARLGLGEPLVARENDRLLATAAWLAHDPKLACAAADRLAAPEQPPYIRRLGEGWQKRCGFTWK